MTNASDQIEHAIAELPSDLPRRLPSRIWKEDGKRRQWFYCKSCSHNIDLHQFGDKPWPCRFCSCSELSHPLIDIYVSDWMARRARNQRPSIPESVRTAVLDRDGLICRYCGRRVHRRRKGPSRLHLDHVFPRSLGGGDTAENLVVSCARCNLAKHDNPSITPNPMSA